MKAFFLFIWILRKSQLATLALKNGQGLKKILDDEELIRVILVELPKTLHTMSYCLGPAKIIFDNLFIL